MNLRAGKIENVIGFKCHMCLNKRPPVCPHQGATGGNKAELVSENNTNTGCTGEDSNCFLHQDDRSLHLKSCSNDGTDDLCLTVTMEKQSSGSMPDSDQKDKDIAMSEKILLGNDAIELVEERGEVLNAAENGGSIPNTEMATEAECSPLMHNLVKNDLTNETVSGICSR